MFKTILVPIDLHLEASWRKALPVAIEQARMAGGTVHVMTVAPEIDPNLRVTDRNYCAWLEEVVGRYRTDDVPVQTSIKHGSVHRQIRRAAHEVGADLILLASHNPRASDYLLGSNAAHVVTHSRCSVLVVRE
tara:strand:- start:593 stop:991 length:399 start_codon:yes stop_codon:yes gene_type:complete